MEIKSKNTVTVGKICCDKMAIHLKYREYAAISIWKDKILVHLRAYPQGFNESELRSILSDTVEISYCPFCGEEIEKFGKYLLEDSECMDEDDEGSNEQKN